MAARPTVEVENMLKTGTLKMRVGGYKERRLQKGSV
jgi:hypothetical protein